MPCAIKVKAADDAIRKQREVTAERVIAHFGNRLPDRRLLCFFDDEDWQALKDEAGAANRGVYFPLGRGGLPYWPYPDALPECLVVDHLEFEHLVYLHGSTCSSEVGLAMTLAHELQHFVQRSCALQLWAASALAADTLKHLEPSEFEASGLRACDIPHEREARIVSKRATEGLFGTDAVGQYIAAKLAQRVSDQDAADWECIGALVASAPYNLADETKLFFPRLMRYKPQLERNLRYLRQADPVFNDVNLDTLLGGTL